MATPSPLDPTAMWRDLVSQWEKGINEVANRAMTSEEFNRGMHGGLGVSLTAQKALGDALGRYLTALNLPTRTEITALGDRLQSIEERLIRIAAMLDQAASAGGGPSAVASAPSALLPMPRRTKRPPAKAPPQEAAGRSPGSAGAERAAGPRPAIESPTEPAPATAKRTRTTGSTSSAAKRAPSRSAGGRRAEPLPAASRQPPSRRKSRAAP